jgi:hypothetical protein
MAETMRVDRRGHRTSVVCNDEYHEIITQILTEIADRELINAKAIDCGMFHQKSLNKSDIVVQIHWNLFAVHNRLPFPFISFHFLSFPFISFHCVAVLQT